MNTWMVCRRVSVSVSMIAFGISACLVPAAIAHGQANVAVEPNRGAAATHAADVLFARPVTVRFERLSLEDAIARVAASAGVHAQYRSSVLDTYTTPVSLDVTNRPLGATLDALLAGTGLRAIAVAEDIFNVAPVKRDRIAGGISGKVTDAKSSRPVHGAVVTLDDSVKVVRTDADGGYRFADVTDGRHRITVRSVGYSRQTKLVTVVNDSTTTINIALSNAINTLDQVVVTATGAQRYRELGHVVATLNADSLVKNAPITSVAELLTARVPGLQVLTSNGGTAGGEIAMRLRGQTTTNLDPQPIIIIDGIRYKNTNTVQGTDGSLNEDQRPFQAEERSPLNDLNVNDIETVEVVKGPSASTLYGPDAANGVILITTKRAKAGKTEWHIYAHPRLADISNNGNGNRPQIGYWAWGHGPNTGQPVPYSCDLLSQYRWHACIQDSITVAPAATTLPDVNVIAQNRPQWQYGANVSGGSEALRYYLSGGYDTQVGSLRIPPLAAAALERAVGTKSLGDAIRNPNTQQIVSTHASVTSTLNAKSSVTLNASYAQTTQRAVNASVFTSGLGLGSNGVLQPGCSQTNPTNMCVPSDYTDGGAYLNTTNQNGTHFLGNAVGTYQPFGWLNLDANLGLDLANSIDRGVHPANTLNPYDQGQVGDYRRSNTGRTAKLGATSSAHAGRLSFRTSLGVQYDYTHQDGLNVDGYALAPGSTSIATATTIYTTQVWNEAVTLGTYGEEEIGLNDRLFLTGGLRLDGSTSFGDAYHPHPFPKVGLSWIASEEPFMPHVPGLHELRFRYSYGAASRYPTSGMKLGTISPYQFTLNGQVRNAFVRNTLANPELRPERSRESEWGSDMSFLSGVVTAGLTWYNRRTNDEIQYFGNPDGLPPQWGNLGDIGAHGFEATLSAQLLDTKPLRASVQFSYSFTTSKVLSLGKLRPNLNSGGDGARVGYPLGSIFINRILGVADTVGGGPDGIVFPQEIIYDTLRYLGPNYPPRTYMLTPSAGLWNGRIRMSTSFDRQTGFYATNGTNEIGFSRYTLDRTTPLLLQAQYQSYQGFFVRGDFTRWREFTVSTDLPDRLMHAALLSRGTINFQVRNLMLWTRFNGPDPESAPGGGTTGHASFSSGTSGIPLARAWTISFDLTP